MATPDTWQERVRALIRQEPLLLGAPSETRFGQLSAPPRFVFMGIGLCTPYAMSEGLPFDVLGMLLPAERLRRALGAKALIVLLADTHALGNGFGPEEVQRRARLHARLLHRLRRRAGLESLQVLLASQLDRHPDYQRLHQQVQAALPEDPDYVTRQVTDVAYLNRRCEGLVKLGWAMSSDPSQSRGDETVFDHKVEAATDTRVPYVYTRAGRALLDQARKGSPYVTVEPERRVLLHPREDVAGKLDRAQREEGEAVVREVRNHLKLVMRCYARVDAPLRARSVEDRVDALIRKLYGGPRR